MWCLVTLRCVVEDRMGPSQTIGTKSNGALLAILLSPRTSDTARQQADSKQSHREEPTLLQSC